MLPPTIPYLYMCIYQGKCSIKQNGEAYSTWYSQAVSHPSTNQAGPCLASQIRRDRAYSGWYGRKWMHPPTIPYLYKWIYQGRCSIKQNEEDIFSAPRKVIILRTVNLLQSILWSSHFLYFPWCRVNSLLFHRSIRIWHFDEWCANMTWTKYFFFIKSIGPCTLSYLSDNMRIPYPVILWWGILSAISKMYLLFIISNTSVCGFQTKVEKAYSTWYSQAVSHPSTNQAGPCLASEIRRDRAYSGWYGRKRMLPPTIPYLYMWIYQGKCSIKQNGEAYSTWYSQAVSHPSTNQAGPCLASEIRRDRAYWGWYGRKWMLPPTIPYLYMCIYQGKCSIKQNGEAYSTWYSQAVSHPSTNQAGPCLASEIRRDRAYSGW